VGWWINSPAKYEMMRDRDNHDDDVDDGVDIDPREGHIDMGESEEESDDEEEESDDDDDDEDDNVSYDSINANGFMKDETVEKFIRTFHNGDYDAEFDDKLSYDRGVRMPARPTQASYNKPDNWIERNRIGLEKVKEQLEDCIDSVTRGNSFNLMLTHNIYEGQLMDNEEPIVWHEPDLDEYWDHFEAEIDRMRQLDRVTNICGIKIMNVEMTKERLAALLAIFRNGRAKNSSTQVIFDNANLCGEGIMYLSKLVDVSSNLHDFYLFHNRIDNMESARCLSMSLKSHTFINELDLAHCDLGSNPEILSVILQSDIKHINLGSNNIDSLGAVKIAEYLEGDPPIEELILGNNRFNDNDAILISQALKRNLNLRHLYLKGNNFTSICVKALLTCVFDGSSLNAISESNHTLGQMDIFSGYQMEDCIGCIERLLALDRTEKIVLALQDKVSLLKYLANVPVDLIPEVLAFPRGQIVDEHKHKHLNIVYSTMRWWNMPLLYSYYNCVQSDTKRKREMTF
jgi:hypothetical protein